MHKANTKANCVAWYRDVFGFTFMVANTLYNDQLLKNKKTLVELKDCNVDSICH